MSDMAPVLAEPPPADAPDTNSLTLPRGRVAALVYAWLILDFFTESRRTGQPSSSLTSTIFGQAFMALVVAALLFPDVPATSFAIANLSLSTLLVGIGHLGDDRAAQRLRADRALVSTSPLPRHHLVLARALHAGFYVCLLTLGMALPPAILGAFLPGQSWLALPLYLLLACVCSGLFTGALLVLLRIGERLFGAARAQLFGGTLKALLLLAGLVAFATAARTLKAPAAATAPPDGLLQNALQWLWPPCYAGRILGGDVWAWPPLLLGLTLLTGIALWFGGEVEPRGIQRAGSARLLERLIAHLCRGQRSVHAIASFTAALLYRSAGFRSKVLPLFGLPAGMWLLALLDRSEGSARLLAIAVQLPAIYLPFLVAFLWVGDEPRARWLFLSSPDLPAAAIRRGVAVALTTHILLPAQCALLIGAMPTLGGLSAAANSLFALGLSILIAKLALRGHDDVPFSGAAGDGQLELGSLLAVAIGLTLLGLGFATLPLAARLPLGLATVAGAWFDLRGRAT